MKNYYVLPVLIVASISFSSIVLGNFQGKNQIDNNPLSACVLEDVATAGLGDVKYSILSEADFQSVNGIGWVLMRGQSMGDLGISNAAGTVFQYLSSVENHSISNLPNPGGRFFRVRNNSATGGDSNPAGVLLLGQAQEDEFKAHDHPGVAVPRGGHDGGGANRVVGVGNSTDLGSYIPDVLPVGGDETRSKNITVNAFIKVTPNCLDDVDTTRHNDLDARIIATEDYININTCDVCLTLPEGNLTELRAKHTCHETEINAFEADTRAWNISCQARTIGHSKRVLMAIGSANRTQAETDFLNHIDNQYPFYNVIETVIND